MARDTSGSCERGRAAAPDDDEIEVTSEMISAGAYVLEDWEDVADQFSLAEKVYIAMERFRRQYT
jgi:hypothetical protein